MDSGSGVRVGAPTAVVADANVLLSAVAGKAALRVFTEFAVRVCVTEFNLREVEDYLSVMGEKYGIPVEILQAQLRLLALERYPERAYEAAMARVPARLLQRDPEDVHAAALALALDMPLWSNDKDLEEAGVTVFTTARLLKILDRTRTGNP